jgi:hypothetical protein
MATAKKSATATATATATAKKPVTAKKRSAGRPKGSTNRYDFNLSATIQEAIKRKGRFTHQRDIVAELAKKAGKVEDPVAFARKVSVLLFAQKSSKKLVQFSQSDSTRDKYYGLPGWLAKNRKPLPGKQPKAA